MMQTRILVGAVLSIGLVVSNLGGLGGCGGAGRGQEAAVPAGNADPLTSEAFTALESGNISEAKTKYDEALKIAPTSAKASFGAALVRMILLSEGEPSKSSLSVLGQKELKVSALAGPDSFLAAWNKFKKGETTEKPDKGNWFPFAGTYPNLLGRLLGNAADSLTGSRLQEILSEYVPLFVEIENLLKKADQGDDFQFTIPKGLYFGEEDILVNRVDLKALRGGLVMAQFGLYLMNSWQFPITVGTLYDPDGNLLAGKQELVDQLNQFFTLKADHDLDAAEERFVTGIQLLLDAMDLIPQITVDGVLEQNPSAADGYAELRDMTATVQKSLVERQAFVYVDPLLNVSLTAFFNNPPDASEVDFDPFVLENGRIRPVEAFFQEILKETIDLDFAKTYRRAFKTDLKGFARVVFDEFEVFNAAGEQLGFQNNN